MMKLSFMSTSSLYIFLMACLFIGCKKEVNYQALVESNMASGKEYNDILFDIKFGMTSQEFYDYCWKLNNEMKADQGPRNRSVQIEVEEFSKPCYMLFYPNFLEDQIVEMPILFALHEWSPWNKESFSNKIIFEVRSIVEDWYDMDLALAIDANEYPGYIGCKGNKKVTLTVQDDQYVKLIVSNMLEIDPGKELVYKRN